MKILFIHKNYPAQFGRLALWLADHGWDVTFATTRENARSDRLRILRFAEHRAPAAETHHYLKGTERAVISGQGLARAVIRLADRGYHPDIVVAHSGWGVGLFVKDIWPDTAYVQYAEWYYGYPPAEGTDPDPGKDPMEERAKARIRNAPFWLDYSAADATLCPTRYQASRFPDKVQGQITVLGDGFDTQLHRPAPRDAAFLAAQGIPAEAELVTYIARGMEPTRGFPDLMRALSTLHRKRPTLHAAIIGADRVAYGPQVEGPSWKARMLAELDLDQARLHFPGLVSRNTMIRFLQASDAHLYLSEPFVLSWSFVEAMSCAAPIVAARSAPVEEFMHHETEGLLVTPSDTGAVASAVERLLEDRALAGRLGTHARARIVAEHDAESIAYPALARFYAAVAETRRGDASQQVMPDDAGERAGTRAG